MTNEVIRTGLVSRVLVALLASPLSVLLVGTPAAADHTLPGVETT